MFDTSLVVVPALMSVAFLTVIERKIMGAMQRRIGPNVVGFYGIMQPFSDALKLILKETLVPQNASKVIFYLAPLITLFCSLAGWAVIPFGAGLVISDRKLSIIYALAISSLGIYGVILAGWSANSKYAFVGSLRSTAQMISYELILSTIVLIVCLIIGSFNRYEISSFQHGVWFAIPLFPLFIIFLITMLAETNRTPFDLPEAESELVAGFFTEHSAMPFVMFFLAEYCSIILISILGTILFLGGPSIIDITSDLYIMKYIPLKYISLNYIPVESLILSIKTLMFCFFFVWVRATLPRLRYDQLMKFCWLNLLPLSIGILILIMCMIKVI